MEVYVSTHLDKYRKPSIYFWKLFEDRLSRISGQKINYDESFYCGDCAGRKFNPTTKVADLKDSDYKFAINAGLKFLTPEDLFLGEKPKGGKRSSELPDLTQY